MSESITSGDIIERLVQQAGIRKKLATDLLRAIPEIIEEGLKTDGEVKVKGLGTFRMKWTGARVGRNPKTGERVDIPAHSRLVFLPEQSFKDFIDRDNRLLSYRVIPTSDLSTVEEQFTGPQNEPTVVSESIPQPIPIEEITPQSEEPSEPEPPKPVSDFVREMTEEPAPVARKKRVHWIVPTAIAVIVVLCVAFYFRNFYSVGSRQLTVDSQKTEDRSQKTEDRSQKSEDSHGTLEPWNPGTTNPEPETRNPKPETRNPEPGTKISTSGQHLFQLAREQYGNPFIWVLIYRANPDKITNPDMVISGREIIIPALEGKPDKLSHNDSLAVSDGYRLVYEYYKAHGDSRADDFRRGLDRYKPK